MNKHIHIRDFDGASHSKLAERARKQGISLSEYLRVELAKLANRPTMAELGERLRQIRGVSLNISSEEIVKIIHDGREERDQQIQDAISSSRAEQN
jgi:antitoxin FitA